MPLDWNFLCTSSTLRVSDHRNLVSSPLVPTGPCPSLRVAPMVSPGPCLWQPPVQTPGPSTSHSIWFPLKGWHQPEISTWIDFCHLTLNKLSVRVPAHMFLSPTLPISGSGTVISPQAQGSSLKPCLKQYNEGLDREMQGVWFESRLCHSGADISNPWTYLSKHQTGKIRSLPHSNCGEPWRNHWHRQGTQAHALSSLLSGFSVNALSLPFQSIPEANRVLTLTNWGLTPASWACPCLHFGDTFAPVVSELKFSGSDSALPHTGNGKNEAL